MAENKSTSDKKTFSPDWLVRGILSKIGEAFDRLTGRNWKPSSSLATSELTDRLKKLLDAEVKDLNEKGKFVPHNIKLKMQWGKFSTDAEESLKKLEHELLTAAIDHINDRRYHTFAPMSVEIKPDYFTEGIKLSASFDNFSEDEREAAVNVSIPDLKNVVIAPVEEIAAEPDKEIYIVEFAVHDKMKRVELAFAERQRLSVGRTKENDLHIDDPSVSKIHAALVLNSDRQLMVADTGSTNGTFINSQRIAYGKAIPIKTDDKLKFGTVEVSLERVSKDDEPEEIPVAEDVPSRTNLPTNSHIEVKENNQTEVKEKVLIEPSVSENQPPPKTIAITAEPAAREENGSPTEKEVVLDFSEDK